MQELVAYSLLALYGIFYIAQAFPSNLFQLDIIIEFAVVLFIIIIVIITVWYNQTIESTTQLILGAAILGIFYDITRPYTTKKGLGAAIAALQYIHFSVETELQFIQIVAKIIGVVYVLVQTWRIMYYEKRKLARPSNYSLKTSTADLLLM